MFFGLGKNFGTPGDGLKSYGANSGLDLPSGIERTSAP